MDSLLDEREVVVARAPGKVIISGEHAVVHGTAAVAAALNRYTTVRLSRPLRASDGDGVLSLELLELKVHLKWQVDYVRSSVISPLEESGHLTAQHDSEIKAAIEDFLAREMPANVDKGASAGVAAFLFLYIRILGLQPLQVVITSELPVGSGLGSSAAFCVALTGALLTVAGKLELQRDNVQGKWMDIVANGRDLVNTWAFEGEKIIHGKPSGVDNTVSCYGHVVKFKKGNLTRLQNPQQLRMLITNTNVSRNTKALVAGVAERAKRHSSAMAAVFSAVEAISDEVVAILEPSTPEEVIDLTETSGGVDSNSSATGGDVTTDGPKVDGKAPLPQQVKNANELTRLEGLMVMNQGLLQCMGVSHPSIEAICQITARSNLCSKLTGAGGGGCVLTLIPGGTSSDAIQNLKNQLEISGYQCFEAGIGGPGLQIGDRTSLYPDAFEFVGTTATDLQAKSLLLDSE